MLPKISILQIGDLHLPVNGKFNRSIDDKDPRFPAELKSLISSNPIKVNFLKIHALISSGKIDSIVFMGDFSQRGSLDGFESAARYIASSLELSKFAEKITIGIVPGNHDIDRKNANKPDMSEKFKPLTKSLKKNSLPLIPLKKPIWHEISREKAVVKLALLNSCWGCGSKESIPEYFRDRIALAIQESIDANEDIATEQFYERQLDTPAFAKESIEDIVEVHDESSGCKLLLVCAHHNLIPQTTTRLAPYTELLNGGSLRGALLKKAKPTIYMHGHIHTDSIEIIRTPSGGPLILISAPEAWAGFNQVDIIFSREGNPLVCNILKWRIDNSGNLRIDTKEEISLGVGKFVLSDKIMSGIYTDVVKKRSCYWGDLVCKFSDEIAIEEGIEILRAEKLVVVENYNDSVVNWIVRSRV